MSEKKFSYWYAWIAVLSLIVILGVVGNDYLLGVASFWLIVITIIVYVAVRIRKRLKDRKK